MITSRQVALNVTGQVREDLAYSNLVLPAAVRTAGLSSRDAGHATDLTYGSLRWQGLIDAVLDECVTGSTDRVDAEVLDLLRLATYELVVKEEPPHIINEWVNLANRRFRRAAGFVNATLRAVSRRVPDEWRSRIVENLSVGATKATLYSHPQWIVDAFTELVGDDEIDNLLMADNEPPVPTLIALPGLAQRPANSVPTDLSPYGFRSTGGALRDVAGITDGTVRVQDEGSQLAALTLISAMPITAGERWLDVCAGPGGKTAVLASVGLPEGVTVVANEVQPHRAELVRKSLSAFGDRVTVFVRDGREFCAENPETYDRILVDAPCTGLGALRRRPESRWRKNRGDLDDLVPLQRELLSAAIGSLTVGGVVAYVTCSPLTEETVGVVDAVLASHPDVEALDTVAALSVVAPTITDIARGSAAQLYPHRHHTDAMFIQLLRRKR